MELTYRILRSRRRTVAIEITADEILVRAPLFMSSQAIQRFVTEKQDWIEKQLQRRRHVPALPPFAPEELETLSRKAAEILPRRVAYFAELLEISYGRITIRHQKTRWGSCSSKGNLNFNCLLMLAPPQVQDYVVVHELCHRKELNHSKAFWALVERTMPDYRTHRLWLKEHGSALIRRL